MRTEGGLDYLTAAEMAEVDRAAIEDYGIDVLSLMENAGAGVAGLARKMLGGEVAGRRICCLVGKGNNGGDGLVAARRLHGWGAKVTVVLGEERTELRDVPAKQFEFVSKAKIPVGRSDGELAGADLLVDALLGYGSKGDPREPVAELIRRANVSGTPALAVDIPSGLDATTGEPGEPCVVAKATVTFGLPKVGFLNPKARRFLGELYLADISLPSEIYGRNSRMGRVFGSDALVRVW